MLEDEKGFSQVIYFLRSKSSIDVCYVLQFLTITHRTPLDRVKYNFVHCFITVTIILTAGDFYYDIFS